jgi:6-phosphogluconate dehydrogenase
MLNNIGLIGLSTMGGNLARNIANNGFTISVFNRSFQKTQDLLNLSKKLDKPENNKNLAGFKNLEKFVESLEVPRKIILLVKSGDPVDELLAELKPLLTSGDIVIDAGNSNWQDTITREIILEDSLDFEDSDEPIISEKIIYFMGCGISGGAEGALTGPSIMLGGNKESAELVLPIFQKIAAKDFEGKPCVSYLGKNPAGHFVKMVHNGIEYALMQGIAEVYSILRLNYPNQAGYDIEKIASCYKELNSGLNSGYLLEITSKILETKEKNSSTPLLDLIVSKSEAKGTGKWTVEAALELGVAVPNIYAAVNARIQSNANSNLSLKNKSNKEPLFKNESTSINELNTYLELVFVTNYLQGIDLILAAEKEYNWGINIEEVLRIWQGGCIIRSKWLDYLLTNLNNENILTSRLEEIYDNSFVLNSKHISNRLDNLARPVFDSSLNYLKDMLFNQHGQNLIRAQRDYFGQHGYERTDKEGSFSGGWQK